jgi:hypothetical protein
MTSLRADPGMALPPSPRQVHVLDAPEDTLAIPGPATARPFLVEAGPVRIWGAERRGVERVQVDGLEVLADLATTAGGAANLVATPGGVRRELLGPHGSVQETVLAAAAPPSGVVQWRPLVEDGQPPVFGLSFRVLPLGSGGRYKVGEQALVVAHDDRTAHSVITIWPPPESWQVEADPHGGLRVDASVTADPAVTLAVGLTERPASVVHAMEQIALLHRRAQGTERDGVRTETGVAELDDALPWLAWRLGHGAAGPVAAALDLCWWGLGALAVGEPGAARRALTALEARGAHDEAALLAARISLVSGDPEAARQRVSFRPSGPLGAAAASSLADALRYAASDSEVEALRAAAQTSAQTAPPGRATGNSPGLKLPMAGGSAGPGRPALPDWLVAVLGATVQPWPEAEPSTALVEAARVVGPLSTHEPDAYGRWRRALADGMDGGPAGRGSWDLQEHCPAVAGALACGLLHGILAWEPDAPVGRLGLGPRLPAHLAAFRVTGLHMGDVRMTLGYEKDGRRHRFTLEPTSGRVPASVVFQPTVAPGGITEARLDGAPVSLDFQSTRDGGTTKVQIPLDGPRVLELSTQE